MPFRYLQSPLLLSSSVSMVYIEVVPTNGQSSGQTGISYVTSRREPSPGPCLSSWLYYMLSAFSEEVAQCK